MSSPFSLSPTTTAPVFTIKSKDGAILWTYEPTAKQQEFHSCIQPNVLYIGSRGTGKSLALRMEAHIRALTTPNFSYAIIRRSYPELTLSHLNFIEREMRLLGGYFHKTDRIAHYPNGSKGHFRHCADDTELGNLLSAEFYWLGLDELSTIPWDTFRKLAASVRVPKNSGLIAMVRGATNPIGPSARKLKSYYIDKDVDPSDDPDYVPSDWHAVQTVLADNPHIDQDQYRKQFSGLPQHVRKAWLDGEFVIEGAYFIIDGNHFTDEPVSLTNSFIYRAVDFGWHDDAVCLWISVQPNGRAVVFKERNWTYTTAKEIAAEIKAESEGMRVIQTFCDPTMFAGSEATGTSVGDIFEQNGIPLTEAKNDRTAAGYAISEWLNTTLDDGFPKLQMDNARCPMLSSTLPEMRVDPNKPGRIADDKKDHWTISLGYFCMSYIAVPQPARTPTTPTIIQQLTGRGLTERRRILGNESVRKH